MCCPIEDVFQASAPSYDLMGKLQSNIGSIDIGSLPPAWKTMVAMLAEHGDRCLMCRLWMLEREAGEAHEHEQHAQPASPAAAAAPAVDSDDSSSSP